MVTPDWGYSGKNGQWRRLLDRLTIRRVILPCEAIYEKFGDPSKLLPKPMWSTMISVLDAETSQVQEPELDPAIVRIVQKLNRNLAREDLEKYLDVTIEPIPFITGQPCMDNGDQAKGDKKNIMTKGTKRTAGSKNIIKMWSPKGMQPKCQRKFRKQHQP